MEIKHEHRSWPKLEAPLDAFAGCENPRDNDEMGLLNDATVASK